jgi:hypothetical protein
MNVVFSGVMPNRQPLDLGAGLPSRRYFAVSTDAVVILFAVRQGSWALIKSKNLKKVSNKNARLWFFLSNESGFRLGAMQRKRFLIEQSVAIYWPGVFNHIRLG